MAPNEILLFLSVLMTCIQLCPSSQVHVVYMGSKNNDQYEVSMRKDHQLLSALHGGSMEKALESHVYSYNNGFRGFAAKLTEEQALDIAEMPGVVTVFPNQKRLLHTTHSWDFMGVSNDEEKEIPGYSTENQDNVIIGFIDTGIWPESSSFSDEGMPPIPSQWKGKCQAGESFPKSTCNKKIIGARYYLSGYEAEEENTATSIKFKSARDTAGHGSHTASTASGRLVNNMNYNGLASGPAHGGAPLSRIAVYKTCWDSGCYDADLLAAFDDAIKDGVDIISVSLGPGSPQADYFSDAISIGSFHATSHGIIVVASAGNEGGRQTVTNLAPWVFTVAASSMDREFVSVIRLDNKVINGVSLNSIQMKESVRTISASEANDGYFTPEQSSYCLESSLNATKVRGKVLICRHSGTSSESRLEKSDVVKNAGAVGMILIDEVEAALASPFDIPAVVVDKRTGDNILSHVNRSRSSRSLILPAETVIGRRLAPRVAAFSSRGPNSLTPAILKPDIMAPGLNILAAWSPAFKGMKYNVISGTSMSCPHMTGLVALFKAVQPTWSPAAIKSAIMTSATVLNKKGKTITSDPEGRASNPFDYGSGFPVPKAFLKTGLIYDTQPSDYKSFLCSIGYDNISLQKITGDNSTCTKYKLTPSDLNYPSIAIPDLKNSYTVTRTLTNVGNPDSKYEVEVVPPMGIDVIVKPKVLHFTRFEEKASFIVFFRVVSPSKDYVFGSLSWKAVGVGQVDSPVTIPLAVRVADSDTGLI